MSKRRVLVVRLSSLGDVVLTEPVFRNLKAAWPDATVAALVKPQFAAALESHPSVDEVIRFRSLTQALREIKRRGFTHLLDLHGTFRSFLIRRLSGVPEQVRYRKDAAARRLFVWLGHKGPALERHTLDRYLDALAAWGVPARYRTLELPRASAAECRRAPSRILVLQTAFLGDAALTVPLVKALRRRFPASKISVLCRPETADLFRGPADEALEDDKRGAGLGVSRFFRLVKKLRKRRFDLAIVPHRSFRSAVLAFAARAPERVGFDASAGSWLFTRLVPFSWLMHDLERNLSLLGPLGPDEAILNGMEPSPDGRVAARLLAAGRDPSRRLVGVHPGSVWATKRWPAERFAALVSRLCREAGAQVVLVGGAGDRPLAASVREASGAGPDCLDWTGETTLPELIELMRELSLFVTNDSGPMHLATASGVPTLAFFGPTTRELGFFPYGQGHRVLEKDLPCRPCGLHGAKACPEGHFLCMRLITADEAYRNALEMLKLGEKEARPA